MLTTTVLEDTTDSEQVKLHKLYQTKSIENQNLRNWARD